MLGIGWTEQHFLAENFCAYMLREERDHLQLNDQIVSVEYLVLKVQPLVEAMQLKGWCTLACNFHLKIKRNKFSGINS